MVGTNLAYSLHFYAGSHGQPLRDKADYALSKGLAIFITEWGTTHADGGSSDRKVYTEASAQWLAWADQRQIPWANWSLMDKDESSSALLPGASNKGAWPEVALSPSGRWVREQIRKRSSPPATPATR